MSNIAHLLSVHERNIYELIKSYAKIYPNMTKLFEYNQPFKSRIPGYEAREVTPSSRLSSDGVSIWYDDSLRRTKTKLSDLIVSNSFDLFCTFTFAEDRYNIEHLRKQMQFWLNNQQKRVGKFGYLIVPEFHGDKKAIHFHALFSGYKGRLVDSGHKRKDGRVVYNIKGYTIGFSTATKIDTVGVPLVASYVKKYITKDMPQFSNKKRYWCSHGLIRPMKVKNPVVFPYEYEKFTEQHQTTNYNVRIAKEKINLIGS